MVACAVKLSPPIALSYFTRAFRTSTGVPTLALRRAGETKQVPLTIAERHAA
jgi:hypothetical protein